MHEVQGHLWHMLVASGQGGLRAQLWWSAGIPVTGAGLLLLAVSISPVRYSLASRLTFGL